jgi:hypothetical protein
MKKGDEFVSKEDGVKRARILDIRKEEVVIAFERRRVDKSTGEVSLDEAERTVPKHLVPTTLKAYEKARRSGSGG